MENNLNAFRKQYTVDISRMTGEIPGYANLYMLLPGKGVDFE